MDRGAWWASVHRDAKSQTQLSQTQFSTHVSIKLSQVVLVLKNLPANAGDIRDVGLIPGSGRSPGVRNGNMLQYSCLENSMDRGAYQAMVHGVKESDATEHTHTSTPKHKAIITKTVLWWWERDMSINGSEQRVRNRLKICAIDFFWPHHMASGILVPWLEIEPGATALDAQILKHWTTKEVPSIWFLTKVERRETTAFSTSGVRTIGCL